MDVDFDLCGQLRDEMWVASIVCFTGATSFVVSLIFLIIAIVMENKRLKKVQNDIVILRTSSRNNAFSSPTPIAPRPATLQPANLPYIPTIHEDPQDVGELSTPNRFPNSFSYTPDGIPPQRQGSFAGQTNNYNRYSAQPTGAQGWPPGPQMYSGTNP